MPAGTKGQSSFFFQKKKKIKNFDCKGHTHIVFKKRILSLAAHPFSVGIMHTSWTPHMLDGYPCHLFAVFLWFFLCLKWNSPPEDTFEASK